jgi:HAD superfamily hydrolase (TIGR01549 family)
MARRIRGILFDLGDTILDFGKMDVDALFREGAKQTYEYLQAQGHSLPSPRWYHLRQWLSIRWHYALSQLTEREFSSLELITRLGRGLGYKLSREEALEVAWRWYLPMRRVATVEEGLRAVLDSLRDAGIRIGLVSNTFVASEVLDRHLQEEGLLDCFPLRIYSSDAGHRKPHAGIFRMALKRIGLGAGETLFVGDSPRADIQGAGRVGLVTVLKDPTGRRRTWWRRPDYRIQRLAELPGIIQQRDDGA